MIGRFSGQALVKASHEGTTYHDAIYRAHFPYADYHLTNQKSAPATVIGGRLNAPTKGVNNNPLAHITKPKGVGKNSVFPPPCCIYSRGLDRKRGK